MAFDFKKEFKKYYMPKNKPQIIEIPSMNYIAVRGKGNPNEEGGIAQSKGLGRPQFLNKIHAFDSRR